MAEDPTAPSELRRRVACRRPAHERAGLAMPAWGPWASVGWTVLAAVVLLGTHVAMALVVSRPSGS